MRNGFVFACIAGLTISGAGATTHNADEVRGKQPAGTSADSSLKDMFEAKIKS